MVFKYGDQVLPMYVVHFDVSKKTKQISVFSSSSSLNAIHPKKNKRQKQRDTKNTQINLNKNGNEDEDDNEEEKQLKRIIAASIVDC